MMHSKSDITADVLFCDDIRDEIGGKISLMGIYTGDLVVPEIPHTMPTLGLFITLSLDDVSAIDAMGVGVTHGEFSEIAQIDEKILSSVKEALKSSHKKKDKPTQRHRFLMNLMLTPFRITEESFINVDIHCATGHIHGGRLNVRIGSSTKRSSST